MAASRRIFTQLRNSTTLLTKNVPTSGTRRGTAVLYAAGAVGAITGLVYARRRRGEAAIQVGLPVVMAKEEEEKRKFWQRAPPQHKMSDRERRFREFSSVEYKGQMYMTPRDFLESVTEERPRPRIGRRPLMDDDVSHMLKKTPSRHKGSTKFFRSMHEEGIISFTEYLFLLCILTKPHAGFNIAFNMFDTDGNQRVDKNEFMVLQEIFRKKNDKRKAKEEAEGVSAVQKYTSSSPIQLERSWGRSVGNSKLLADGNVQDTTLLVHLFGVKGKDDLNFQDFYKFMDNLQTEILELEFLEFARGMPTISEIEFAQILLRYTHLPDAAHDAIIERLKDRIPEEKSDAGTTAEGKHEKKQRGITFDQFKPFFQFLNNLDDFAIAMQMYTFANQPVEQAEFKRAVKVSTGIDLAPHVINTVFQIFDEDGDGKLSHKEFISVMKDRIHRGFRKKKAESESYHGWEGYKTCLKDVITA
ncbi:calcium uptake protein 3, mitochondrial-like isoform X7 [Branchiostoma floridae]|uniref:Calcium uptake protein 3, mitochondrial-like isoform X7 n=1 Tax=Branchiostoma floridae TaxID=7739 RepID=A0A9J7LHS4_BRAFL|nr:calcium uptake protein 3, mitochondrial-like isoform X7 [Branchiostoma floridae]XP_035682364.1 calcium uptake protein 3, mitochondrial-like isoform X7 [Branchiostoma floridae]